MLSFLNMCAWDTVVLFRPPCVTSNKEVRFTFQVPIRSELNPSFNDLRYQNILDQYCYQCAHLAADIVPLAYLATESPVLQPTEVVEVSQL